MMNSSQDSFPSISFNPNYPSFYPEIKINNSPVTERKKIIPFQKKKSIHSLNKSFNSKKHSWILAATIILIATAVFTVFKLQPSFEELRISRLNNPWGLTLIIVSLTLLAVRIFMLLYMFVQSLRYKSIKSVSDELLPTCTIIVPAYNEGELVMHTLMSIVESDYPKEKLQIIAVDDGSKDDTWEWMKKAKLILGDRLDIYQQPENKGKRHALYRGFQLGTGDIFVTIDSDSLVKKDTLRNMASPFVVNENCGAVAGNVRVLNNKKAIIPKMLNVSFAFSFEFIRSAQSASGSVLCTPGALAAYRRDAVLNCLPDWINQTFMGKASDIGEDRAMTNMILKQGHHVLFQRNAYVLTNTPEKFKGLYKMFIRWERSNVREALMMSKFAFGKFREGSKAGARIFLLDQLLKTLISYPMTILMLWFLFSHPLLSLSSAILSIFIFSSVQAIFYAKRYNVLESFWAYTYSIFYTFTLFWITPYAIATAAKRGWLTRNLS